MAQAQHAIQGMLSAVVVLTLAGCAGPNHSNKLRIGEESTDDGGTFHAPGSQADGGGVNGRDQTLRVHVEDSQKLKVELITLQCAGDCADIQAVAVGGNAPYAFEWEDGSSNPIRHVCLDASKSLHVSVTDTAIDDDEFHYDAHTALADVTANVLDCSDGGQAMCDTLVALPPDGTYSGAYNSDVLAGLSGGTASLMFMRGAGTQCDATLTADLIGVLHAVVALSGEVDCVTGELVLRGVESGNGADGRLWVVTLKYDPTTGAFTADYAALCVPGAAVCSYTKVAPPPPMPHQKVMACGPGVEVCGDSGTFTGAIKP